MASNDFGLAKAKYKRVDGSGKVYSAPITPAAVINGTEACERGDVAADTVFAYLNADYEGLLPKMGFEPDEDAGIRANAIEWSKRWRYIVVDVDDDGREIADDEEENPTRAS